MRMRRKTLQEEWEDGVENGMWNDKRRQDAHTHTY
jgi:hypothetical protein